MPVLTAAELLAALRAAGIQPRLEDDPENPMRFRLMVGRGDELAKYADEIRRHRDGLIWLLAVESVAGLPRPTPSRLTWPDTADESWETWKRLLGAA